LSESSLIPVGASATESVTVTRELTVAHFAAGMPEVYGTPLMIYLLECAAAKAIQQYLPSGWVSVGTEVHVRHLAATPIGFFVTATATVTAVSGKTVSFAVRAHDGVEPIGEGTHTRAIIELGRFQARMVSKARPAVS
jgi:predicted thioesterase